MVARRWHKPPADRAGCSGGECGCMVVVVGDVSCSVLLLAVVCCDGPLRGGLAGGRVEDSGFDADHHNHRESR